MDRALQRHTELSPLWRTHVRNKGRYGSPRARILLQAAGDNARSHAERLLIKLAQERRHHRLGRQLSGRPATSSTSHFRGRKIAIEVDGFAFHTDAEVFQHDRNRQNYLVLNGWQILRFTWQDLVEHPERVIAEIRRAISV